MQDLIEQIEAQIRAGYPAAEAVILKGSHARGEAGPWSDIDFDVLVSTPDTEIYRTWLVPFNDRLVHVSAAVETLQSWLAESDETSSWSLGLPTEETTKLLWARTEALWQQLDHPARTHPAAAAEVEDSAEALGKIHGALARGDAIGVYRNAHKLATLIPTLLVPVNPVVAVSNSRAAIDAICAFPYVPPGFVEDWLLCMGYVETRSPELTAETADRLLRGVLAQLPADPEVVGEDIAAILTDGRLIQYLDQLSRRSGK